MDKKTAFTLMKESIDSSFFRLVQDTEVSDTQSEIVKMFKTVSTEEGLEILQKHKDLPYHESFFFPQIGYIFLESNDPEILRYIVDNFEEAIEDFPEWKQKLAREWIDK